MKSMKRVNQQKPPKKNTKKTTKIQKKKKEAEHQDSQMKPIKDTKREKVSRAHFITNREIREHFETYRQQLNNVKNEEEEEPMECVFPVQMVNSGSRKGLQEDRMLADEKTFKYINCISMYNQNMSISDISKKTGLSWKTVQSIIRRYENGENLLGNKRGTKQGDMVKIDRDTIYDVISLASREPQMTLQQITDKVNEQRMKRRNASNGENKLEGTRQQSESKVNISLESVRQIMIKLGYTVKSIKKEPTERNTTQRIKQRQIHSQHIKIMEDIGAKTVYVDEVGMSLSQRRKKGRSKKGRSCDVKTNFGNRKNITCITMMVPGHRLVFRITSRNTNKVFVDTIKQLFIPKLKSMLSPDSIVHVILDNASSHREGVVEAFEKEGIFVTYNVPYSPQLNSIEQTFSKSKNILSQYLTNDERFTQAMKVLKNWKTNGERTKIDEQTAKKLFATSLLQVTGNDTMNYHHKTMEFNKICEKGIPLTNDAVDTQKIERTEPSTDEFDLNDVVIHEKSMEVKGQMIQIIDVNCQCSKMIMADDDSFEVYESVMISQPSSTKYDMSEEMSCDEINEDVNTIEMCDGIGKMEMDDNDRKEEESDEEYEVDEEKFINSTTIMIDNESEEDSDCGSIEELDECIEGNMKVNGIFSTNDVMEEIDMIDVQSEQSMECVDIITGKDIVENPPQEDVGNGFEQDRNEMESFEEEKPKQNVLPVERKKIDFIDISSDSSEDQMRDDYFSSIHQQTEIIDVDNDCCIVDRNRCVDAQIDSNSSECTLVKVVKNSGISDREHNSSSIVTSMSTLFLDKYYSNPISFINDYKDMIHSVQPSLLLEFDQQVLFCTIKKDDVNRLANQSCCLSQDIVDYFTNHMNHIGNNEYHIFPTSVCINIPIGRIQYDTRKVLLVLSHLETVIFLMHIETISLVILDNGHYFSFICQIDLRRKRMKFMLYDSLFTEENDKHRIYRKTIETLINIVAIKNGKNTMRMEFEMMNVPKQRDHTSCGVFLLYYLHSFFVKKQRDCRNYTVNNAMKMRMELVRYFHGVFKDRLN